MNIEYHHWWSSHLGQEMELKVYGHSGKPVLVFPAMGGRFFEFEDFGMIDATWRFIESGKVQFFTVDSIDNQSWANEWAHPADRAKRHEDYDRYITQEVVPWIRERLGAPLNLITTGCSMGGYHAGNFFFRHPDLFDGVIALSGLFQLRMFVGNYSDDLVYFNSPLYYLPNLTDPFYLERYRKSNIIICTGQGAWEEAMVADARAMEKILKDKDIPAWIDFWGYDVNHDWPWWQKQLPYFLNHLFGSF
jgi:esterase/lipase superfamily enzyme